ncbi:MAG: PD40 domain-containing protein [Steroidobacteraceae bacterium]|nr:PD40 domain-containing protein [Steroidobacteraceae bacterium]
MRGVAVAVLLACAGPALGAQGGTDIWVVTLRERVDNVTLGQPVNVTRRAGYDNQPAFTPDGQHVLFTSIREDAQADIYRVPVTGGEATRVIGTPESEYSATPLPTGDGLSVIRVELDSTQRLWRFDWSGRAQRALIPALKPVGYHVWVGTDHIGAFVLGSPNALVLINALTERVDTLARGIGRAFARVPDRAAFTFVHFHGDTSWIGEVDVRTQAVRRVAIVPPGGEYHVWTPGGALLATAGSRIYRRAGNDWVVIADYTSLGVRSISRIAINPQGDRLAFVAADP